MRFLILGGGGLGTVLAGFLSRAGEEVTLYLKPAQAAAFERPEVRVTGLADFSAPVRLASSTTELGAHEYLLVCVKARDTEAALAPLRDARIDTVLSLQNGVKKDEILARVFGVERVLGALTGVGGALQALGKAQHTLGGATMLGEFDGRASERAERLAAHWQAAGLPASCVADILPRTWHKLAIFLPGALISSLTRLDVATAMLDPDLASLRRRLMHEVVQLAAAEGQSIDALPIALAVPVGLPEGALPMAALGEDEPAVLESFATQALGLRERGVRVFPSMAQDTIAGRPTELEATAGDLLERAARRGVPVPATEVCARLLRGVERARG